MGLNIAILERGDELRQSQIPDVMQRTCRDWDTWSRNNTVNQIDAGI